MNILIVEDDSNSRVFLERALLSQGYTVESAANGVQALEKALLSPPDLIISDIMMPEMDGFELCRRVKSDERLRTIPFVFYTATYIDQKDEKLAMGIGASRFLIKPMEPEKFFRTIRGVIEENLTGRIPMPDQLPAEMTELDRMQVEVYARKLDKKVRELEQEREAIRKADEELKFRNAILSTQQEASIDGILVVDESGRILSFNRRFCELWNIPSEVLETRSDERTLQSVLDTIVDPDIFLQKVRYLYKYRQETSRDEISLRDGRIFDRYSAPMFGVDGRYYGRVWYFRDITERKQTEEEMRKLSHAVEQSPSSVMITDLHGNIEYVNPKFAEVTGYSLEEVRGKNPRILKSGETPSEEYRKLWETITSGGEWHGVFHNRRRDGTLFWERVSISSVRDTSGTITHFIAVKEDITNQKSLEDQFRQAQKMEAIGQLAGGIAHDFNNILTAIIGYAHMLKMKLINDEKLGAYADYILSLSDKAANLTQSLLAFSRKQIINPKPVNLNDIIRTVEKLLFRIIGEDIKLKTMLSEKDLVVMADHVQIEQALMNLATNARDAMPEGGRLTIETEDVAMDHEYIKEHGYGTEGLYAVISVTDSGEGMDKETKGKIFEPFFTTKEVGKGTGLGLAMVYGIVKQHEGYINVYSEPGKGTTFRIYIPLIQARVEEIKPEFIQPLETGTETILLAEDEPEVRAFTIKLLEEYGYKVIDAVDGEDAIGKFKLHKDAIQLVLLDVIMPNRSGREVYEKIRNVRPDIKVLFTSGYPADHINGIIEKGSDFILKPVSPTKLLQKIREMLGQ
jgi:PAS domain S-box-containing protein